MPSALSPWSVVHNESMQHSLHRVPSRKSWAALDKKLRSTRNKILMMTQSPFLQRRWKKNLRSNERESRGPKNFTFFINWHQTSNIVASSKLLCWMRHLPHCHLNASLKAATQLYWHSHQCSTSTCNSLQPCTSPCSWYRNGAARIIQNCLFSRSCPSNCSLLTYTCLQLCTLPCSETYRAGQYPKIGKWKKKWNSVFPSKTCIVDQFWHFCNHLQSN